MSALLFKIYLAVHKSGTLHINIVCIIYIKALFSLTWLVGTTNRVLLITNESQLNLLGDKDKLNCNLNMLFLFFIFFNDVRCLSINFKFNIVHT